MHQGGIAAQQITCRLEIGRPKVVQSYFLTEVLLVLERFRTAGGGRLARSQLGTPIFSVAFAHLLISQNG